MFSSMRPTRAEVDLAAVRRNASALRSLLKPGVKFCAVVKADGYGHGAARVAEQALGAGADYLAVAILDEALALRAQGFDCPILVLGYTPVEHARTVVAGGLTQTIFNMEQAVALSAAAGALGLVAKVHLKVDSGMCRLGVMPEQAADFAQGVENLNNIYVEGIYTHFAQADSADKTSARGQLEAFKYALDSVRAAGVDIPIKHCANSAALLDLPEAHMDMVRAGISLYGLWPSGETTRPVELVPAMRFKTKVAMLKTVPAGTPISYGWIYRTPEESVIATLPVGYADGWTRMLSGKAHVLAAGQRVPLVGRICMDQCMIDVTGVQNLKEGDDVLLFGGPELPVEEAASLLETISYELVCMVGKRVPRVYING